MRRPHPSARRTSPVCSAYISTSSRGIQTGSSPHGSMPWASTNSGVAQTSWASEPVTSTQDRSRSPMVALPTGATTSTGPLRPAAAASRPSRARSRASTCWMPRSSGPGASTSPPREMRRNHHGSRPTFSRGPRMSPARRCTTRSGPSSRSRASSRRACPRRSRWPRRRGRRRRQVPTRRLPAGWARSRPSGSRRRPSGRTPARAPARRRAPPSAPATTCRARRRSAPPRARRTPPAGCGRARRRGIPPVPVR